MVPVARRWPGSKLPPDTVLFIGWFGPAGSASTAFGLTAMVSLTEVGVDVAVLSQTVALTVLLSVVVHGLSAQGLARWYGRSAVAAGEMDPARGNRLDPTAWRGRASLDSNQPLVSCWPSSSSDRGSLFARRQPADIGHPLCRCRRPRSRPTSAPPRASR